MELTETAAIIEALGGTDAVAKLTGRKYSAAFNWRSFETFPPDTYLVMQRALRERGYDAPPRLWRMVESAQ
jgi:ABC-type hemin transport system substrate-binding protein